MVAGGNVKEAYAGDITYSVEDSITMYVGQTYTLTMKYNTNCIVTAGGNSVYNNKANTIKNTEANRAKVAGDSKRTDLSSYNATVSGYKLTVTGKSAGSNTLCILKKNGEGGRKISITVLAKPTCTISNAYAWSGDANKTMTAKVSQTNKLKSYSWTTASGVTCNAASKSTNTVKFTAPTVTGSQFNTYAMSCTAAYGATSYSNFTISGSANLYVYPNPTASSKSVTYNGGTKESGNLKIQSPSKTINGATDVYLYPGQTATLAINRTGVSLNSAANWTSKNTSVASVGNSNSTTTTVTAKAAGTATVECITTSSPTGVSAKSVPVRYNIHVINTYIRDIRVDGESVDKIQVPEDDSAVLSLSSLGNFSYSEDIEVSDNSKNFITLTKNNDDGTWNLSSKSAFTKNDVAYINIITTVSSGDSVVTAVGTQIIKQEVPVYLGDKINGRIVLTSDSSDGEQLKLLKGESDIFSLTDNDGKGKFTIIVDDTDIATVTPNVGEGPFTITALGVGTTTINIESATGHTLSYPITVYDNPESIKINDIQLTKGSSYNDILILGLLENGGNYESVALDPELLTYSSSDTSIATVSDGNITAKKAGTVTITVTYGDETKITTKFKVTVNELITSMSFVNTNVYVVVGNTFSAIPNRKPSDNTTVGTFVWSTSDVGVATVDETGKVTAKKEGKAVITASANDGSGKSASYTIYVKLPAPTGLKAISVKKNIQVTWNSVKNANYYFVYRKGENGLWEKVGISYSNSYIDRKAVLGTTYMYKVVAVPAVPDNYLNQCVSSESSVVSINHKMKTPSIKLVKKSGGKCKITIKGTKYTGFAIYVAKTKKASMKAKALKVIVKGKKVSIKLPKGKCYIRVRAYVKLSSGKYIYSDFSKPYKYKAKKRK